mmetsp:Transcript_14196/g.36756  ORF Transcript_14196/g.36756 Transcript_14196/m.36756 type:complete len:210 (-) Transcript_14196:340-969(-)
MGLVQALVMYSLVLCWERLAYGVVYHYTPTFRRIFNLGAKGKADLTIMHQLVASFKVVQIVTVAYDVLSRAAWGEQLLQMQWGAVGTIISNDLLAQPARLVAAIGLIGFGQLLNVSIYSAIGSVGVHYGHQLGHDVPWCTGWPFTWLSNPQYIGVVLTFWGVYLLLAPTWPWMAPEWYAVPLVISFWYTLSCNVLEAGTPRHTIGAKRS